MRSLVIALLVAALVGLAFSMPNNFIYRDRYSSHLDEYDLCNEVGVNSGCSGCVHGTKSLCSASRSSSVMPSLSLLSPGVPLPQIQLSS